MRAFSGFGVTIHHGFIDHELIPANVVSAERAKFLGPKAELHQNTNGQVVSAGQLGPNPILIFGEIVRDVGVMKDMLTGFAFSGQDEYRRNLRVVRNAAERIIHRADRLIGHEPA
jgi:hypothetical protein